MLQNDLIFGVAAGVFRIAGGMRQLPACFDNPVIGKTFLSQSIFLCPALDESPEYVHYFCE